MTARDDIKNLGAGLRVGHASVKFEINIFFYSVPDIADNCA